MKHWVPIISLIGAALAMTALRRSYQSHLLAWSAPRAGRTVSAGRWRALLAHGVAFAVAGSLVALGFWAWLGAGTRGYLRYPAAFLVLVVYVPVAAVGAPKLTKWQKSHEQRLVEEGAARAGARGWDDVARVFSVLGVLLGFAAVFLLAVPS